MQVSKIVQFELLLAAIRQIRYVISNIRAVPLVRKNDAHQGRVFYFYSLCRRVECAP